MRNSIFERYGLWQTSAAAVRLAGVGQEVSGNEMREATGGGVIFDGNDHRITGNLFHHLLGELGGGLLNARRIVVSGLVP